MTLTPEQAADRRNRIAEWYVNADGDVTMQQIADAYGITKQRVSQIVKRVLRDAQRERCARGEHGETTERQYAAWVWGQGPTRVRDTVCNDCGKVIE